MINLYIDSWWKILAVRYKGSDEEGEKEATLLGKDLTEARIFSSVDKYEAD